MSSKTASLSAGLIATKGSAAPVVDMPTRSAALPGAVEGESSRALAPLNFRVAADFRTEFKTYAASHNLKLNQLLKRAFEAYRKQQGD